MMSFSRYGLEKTLQFGMAAGHTVFAPNAVAKTAPCGSVLRPAGWLADCVPPGPTAISAPAVAVLSLATMVLLTICALTVSTSDTPPPPQPATLSTIMLFVIAAFHQPVPGFVGLERTSLPFTSCKRRPP